MVDMGKYNISGTLFFNYGWDVCSADKYGTQIYKLGLNIVSHLIQ